MTLNIHIVSLDGEGYSHSRAMLTLTQGHTVYCNICLAVVLVSLIEWSFIVVFEKLVPQIPVPHPSLPLTSQVVKFKLNCNCSGYN